MKSKADFDDIQGLVRFAHAHLDEAAYLLLRVDRAESARSWLRAANFSSAAKTETLPDTAMQIAISAEGLTAIGVKQATINEFSDEFIAGMADANNRSRRLGDTGLNGPEHWQWGDPAKSIPDIVLMIFSRTGKLAETIASIKSDEFLKGFELLRTLDTKSNQGNEHFGFADGISQPKTDWQQQVSVDLHERDRYANLLALGEVILGYPNEYGLYTDRPLIDAVDDPAAQVLPKAEDHPQFRDLGKHGTYLVFRQLSQDVSGFWQFVDQQTDSVAAKREHLAAAMVGRQLDGQPLMDIDKEPIQGINPKNKNHFTYDSDPHGVRCPIGSHVRRANPRTGDYPPGVNGLIRRIIRALGFKRVHPTDDVVASSRFHRVLRRGRPYGDALSIDQALDKNANKSERGLHFICLGANISRQFEFVQNAWLMSSKFAGLSGETDPLLGNREPLYDGSATDQFNMPEQYGPSKCLAGLPQFVTMRGGAYFFMPGIAALKYLAAERSDGE